MGDTTDPDIAFFVGLNPGFAKGDHLMCLVPLNIWGFYKALQRQRLKKKMAKKAKRRAARLQKETLEGSSVKEDKVNRATRKSIGSPDVGHRTSAILQVGAAMGAAV